MLKHLQSIQNMSSLPSAAIAPNLQAQHQRETFTPEMVKVSSNNKASLSNILGVFQFGFKRYVNGLHLYQGHYLTLVNAAILFLSAGTPHLHRQFFFFLLVKGDLWTVEMRLSRLRSISLPSKECTLSYHSY